MNNQVEYGNNWERTVVGTEDFDPKLHAREIARYQHACNYIKPGMNILEIGCSSGFGLKILPKDITYTGVDYDAKVIEFAKECNPGYTFICTSIDDFLAKNIIKYDLIIAFEVLEHVLNGREAAQELKKHCKELLCSSPYKEPPGLWGPFHVLHRLEKSDFPEFEHTFMHYNGHISPRPDLNEPNLMIMHWKVGEQYPKKKTVLCSIPTKNRPNSLLHCLQSVALQTVKPDKVIVYDDGDRQDLREHDIGKYILPLLWKYGIEWEVLFMPGKGQHIAHELANTSGFDYVWRMDDDGVAEPDVLERLLAYMADDVGAVGGAVYELQKKIPGGSSDILNFFDSYNFQWAPDQGIREVDWMYSSFLYRAGIVHYKHNMSPVAFHEETIFSHRLKRAGYRLIVDTSIHTYHFKAPRGGCREEDHKWAYAWDNQEFMNIMEKEWGIKTIVLRGGLGDNLAFLNILPELKEKYNHLIISTCHPEVYEDVKTMPFREDMLGAGEVYAWMTECNWQGSLLDAFRKMYL